MKTIQSNSIYDLRFTIYERLLARARPHSDVCVAHAPERGRLVPANQLGTSRPRSSRFTVALLLLLSLVFAGLSFSARAAGPPEAMTYQGYLVDANGNPLATNNPANYPVIFRIFAAATGGSSLWSEQQIVTVDKGNFSVILSEGTSIGEPKPLLSAVMGTNGADRYIELSVTVPGTPQPIPMLPRMRLLPSAYAFLSTSANQLINPAGAAVVTYANSRVEVAGNLAASGTISGNGSALTGLTAAQVGSGTFADARLSANVALRAGGNTFSGDQTISGNVGIRGAPVDASLDVEGDMRLNDFDLFFRSNADRNHGLAYYGGPDKYFAGINVDGPVLYGWSGGGLASKSGGDKLALSWDGDGNVGIGVPDPTAKLDVNGGIKVSGSNTLEFGAGVAGKEVNAGKIAYAAFTPNTLDIVGAGATAASRKVKIHAEGGTDFVGPVSFNGERLFHFRTHGALDGNGHNGAVSQATGVSTNTHHMAVVGTDCKNGEIYEARALVENGLWVLHAYIRGNDGSALTWRIYTMSVARSLTTTNSSMAIAIP